MESDSSLLEIQHKESKKRKKIKKRKSKVHSGTDSDASELGRIETKKSKNRKRTEKSIQVDSDNNSDVSVSELGRNVEINSEFESIKSKNRKRKKKRSKVHSDTDSDSSKDDEEFATDITNNKIFTRRVLHSDEAVSRAQAKRKKDGNTRVYNKVYSCLFCSEIVQHIPSHLRCHKDEPSVQKSIDNHNYEKIRRLGCDVHNRSVISKGEGEIVGLARLVDDSVFDVKSYGPCPSCRQWCRLSGLKQHFKSCSKQKIQKKDLVVRSQVLAGHVTTNPSELMVKEVFSIMKRDDIGAVARGDKMIVALGESWLRRNIDNKEKRKYYASQRMRLAARLLIELRTLKGDHDMYYFLQPAHFDAFVTAALNVSLPFMDDAEELKSPSNAIKVKYDINRMVNAKFALAIKAEQEDVVKTCENFLTLMRIEWGESVTKLARSILAARSMSKSRELPDPVDVKKLTEFLKENLEKTDLLPENFERVRDLCEAFILLYNKHRSGEIEVIQ